MNAIGEYLLRDYISKTDADLRDIAFRLSNNVADPQVKIAKLLHSHARGSEEDLRGPDREVTPGGEGSAQLACALPAPPDNHPGRP